MTALQLAIGALTLLTNAFFVGAEFALIAVRRSQVEPDAHKGDKRARTVLYGLEHLSAMMATAQLGITVSSLVLGAVAEPAIAHLLEPGFEAARVPEALVHPIAFVIALTVATYLHMLFGEMVPKNIALAAPARTALLLGPPLVALTRALRPLIFGINAFANVLLRLIKVEPKDEVAAVFNDDELARMVAVSSEAGLLAGRRRTAAGRAGAGHPPGRRHPRTAAPDGHRRPPGDARGAGADRVVRRFLADTGHRARRSRPGLSAHQGHARRRRPDQAVPALGAAHGDPGPHRHPARRHADRAAGRGQSSGGGDG